MRWLLRLYPKRWRERYETEFLDLLYARPLSPRDLLDIALGALDAHLHYSGAETSMSQGREIAGQLSGWFLAAVTLSMMVLLLAPGYSWLADGSSGALVAHSGGWSSILALAFALVGLLVTAAYLWAGFALLRLLRETRDHLSYDLLDG